MVEVGKAVYDGHLGCISELLDLLVGEGTHHYGVYVAGEDTARIRGGLALAHLYLLRQEVEGVAAQLVHADLERDAGAVGGFLEDHRERSAAQGTVGDVGLLECLYLESFVEDELRLLRGELGQSQAVATGEGRGGRRVSFELGDHR